MPTSAPPPSAALVLPFCNTAGMNLHLAEISRMVSPGRHAVLLLDQPWRIMSIGMRDGAHRF